MSFSRASAGVSFLECDVQGQERRVFWGATEIIGREYPVFLAGAEQQRLEDVIDSTFDFLQSHSYRGRLSLATGCLTSCAKTRPQQWALDDPSGIRAT
jgi:hypothetical protein